MNQRNLDDPSGGALEKAVVESAIVYFAGQQLQWGGKAADKYGDLWRRFDSVHGPGVGKSANIIFILFFIYLFIYIFLNLY
jgi:hypothetical protein